MLKKFEKRVLLSPPQVSGHEIKYIQRALDDNWIVPLGPNVNEFETSIANYLSEKKLYAVAMSSGTAAIHIALRLLDLQPGEEVFCSSATFVATANPILYEKAVPVFIDSEDKTWNLCADSLLKAIEAKKKTGKIPRVLICVDLFGMSADYEKIIEICKQYQIKIIEDSAESLGSSYKSKKCGVFGDYGILSFNGNKIITTSGGGMLICHSQEEANKALFFITQARDKAPYYLHSEIGYNYRMSNVCAGIGLGQLQTLDERVQARRKNYNFYSEFFKNSDLIFPESTEPYYSNHWLSVAVLRDSSRKTPSELISHLDSYNIEARHVWKPLHTQPIFKSNQFFHVKEKPVAESIFEKGICLPSGADLSVETLQVVSEILKSAL